MFLAATDPAARHLRQPVLPELYRPLRQAPPGALSLASSTRGEPLAYVSAVRAAVNRVHRDAAVQYINSMAALLEEQVTLVRWLMLFGAAAACLALALAALGLYGVIACLVARRTPEIGLRVALGANAQAVVGLVLRSGARTVAAGLALGIPLAVGATQILRAILLDAGSPPALTFAAVAVVILAVDLCAMWIPARLAARVDPAIALRAE
jgi:ABC-type antimicrobial peptide transport system permease subunit